MYKSIQIYFNCDVMLQNFSKINDLKETKNIDSCHEYTLVSGSIQTNISNSSFLFTTSFGTFGGYSWNPFGEKLWKNLWVPFGPPGSIREFSPWSFFLSVPTVVIREDLGMLFFLWGE